MEHEERIKKIKEHFENITIDEFEDNLIEAGIEEIKPASESGWKLR